MRVLLNQSKDISKTASHFILFMLIFLTSSFVISNDIWSSSITIILWFALMMVLLLRSTNIKGKYAFITMALICIMGITTIINGEDLRNYFLLVFSYAVAMVIASQLALDEFTDIYTRVIRWLCIVSLVCYIAYLIIPTLRGVLLVTNKSGISYSNLVLYTCSTKNMRNQGMFWEPGAFQTFVNLALLFEIRRDKVRISNVVIFVVTILTTYSTTGYMGLVFLLFIWYLKMGRGYRVRFVIVTMAVMMLLGLTFGQSIFNFLFGASLSSGQSTVFGKIINFFGGIGTATSSSASIRYNAVIEVLKAAFERPILGYGYSGLIERTYSYTFGMNTCTFVNWFAVYGVLYGSIILVGYIGFSRRLYNKTSERIMVFLLLFCITMSENYIHNVFFLLPVYYGMERSRIGKDLFGSGKTMGKVFRHPENQC